MELRVDTHVFRSFANLPYPQWLWIAELIDNSLDAGASRVCVKRPSDSVIEISDDGGGIDDIEAAISIGCRREHKTDGLGRYGVGLPQCIGWWGGKFAIDTTHKQLRRRLELDFNEQEGTTLPDAEETPSPAAATGTTITLYSRRKTIQWSLICTELSWRFTPAIRNGKRLTCLQRGGRESRLQPVELLQMSDVVKGKVQFDDGRWATYMAGRLDAPLPKTGGPVWLEYGHRRLCASNCGLGEYMSGDFAATVRLHGEWDEENQRGWLLNTNKQGIDEDQLAELGDALEPLFAPVLESISKSADYVELRDLQQQLNARSAGSTARERRRPTSRPGTGTVTQTDKHDRRRRSSKYDARIHGSVEIDGEQAYIGPRIKLDFTRFDNDDAGAFDQPTATVMLNLSNVMVDAMRKAGRADVLWAIAAGLVAACHRSDGMLIPDKYGTPEATLGVLLKELHSQKDFTR